MTNAEIEDCQKGVERLLPPHGIRTTFNGVEIPACQPLCTGTDTLPTVTVNEHGELRGGRRKATIEIHAPADGKGWIYELGIPIVEVDLPWHVNVLQKVPLNNERDNVTKAFRSAVAGFVLATMGAKLDADQVHAGWVKEGFDNRGDEQPIPVIENVIVSLAGQDAVAAEPINELLIHELAHDKEGDHLSDRYHAELSRLAVRLVTLALAEPSLFKRW